MAESEKRNTAQSEKLAADADAAQQRINAARQEAVGNISGMVEDIARQAVERLVNTSPDASAVSSAVSAALEERT